MLMVYVARAPVSRLCLESRGQITCSVCRSLKAEDVRSTSEGRKSCKQPARHQSQARCSSKCGNTIIHGQNVCAPSEGNVGNSATLYVMCFVFVLCCSVSSTLEVFLSHTHHPKA